MSLYREAKQVTDMAARFLPNPKILVTVLLSKIAFINLLNGVFSWPYFGDKEWKSSVTLIGGTAVIGLEKLINKDPAGMFVAGGVGFLIQIVVEWDGLHDGIIDLIIGYRAMTGWNKAVLASMLGLLYAISYSSFHVNRQAKKLNDMSRFLPNPKVLIIVLLWSVAFVTLFSNIFNILTHTRASLVTLVGGTAVIGLEKCINRVKDPAVLVAGVLGFLIQIIMNPYVMFFYLYEFTMGGETSWAIYTWLNVVLGAGLSLMYARTFLAKLRAF